MSYKNTISKLIVTNIKIAKITTSFMFFWYGTIFRNIALFIIVVIGDLARIFSFYTIKRFGITFNS